MLDIKNLDKGTKDYILDLLLKKDELEEAVKSLEKRCEDMAESFAILWKREETAKYEAEANRDV